MSRESTTSLPGLNDELLGTSEQWLRELVVNLEEGIGIVDTDERFVFANPAGERIFGVERGGLVGRSLLDFLDEDDVTVLAEQTRSRSRGEKGRYVLPIRRSDGRRRLIQLSAVPRMDAQGRFVGTFGSFRDVTDRMRMQEELERYRDRLEELVAERTREIVSANDRLTREMAEREEAEQRVLQLQKLDAIGTLAGGIAHDFNNIMTNILGQADLAARRIPPDDALQAPLAEIRQSANHAANLTRQLLLFGRRQPLDAVPIHVGEVIHDMVRMLERVIGEDVALDLRLDHDYCTVLADRSNIEQVIMNLALNARDAMPGGGTLIIETSKLTLMGERGTGAMDARTGDHMCIGVTDTGVGMDEGVKQHVFEPFFTTKDVGVGTGLGLAVVYGIVVRHGGWVDVESEPGSGTTVRIYLPAHEGGPAGEAREEPSVEVLVMPSAVRALVVEDSGGARRFAVQVLEEAGFKVESACNVREAEAVLDARGAEIDLVFSDVILPDGNGLDLVLAVRERWPDKPVLLTSGYTDDRSRWNVISEKEFPFLPKPYGVDALLDAVSRVLDPGD